MTGATSTNGGGGGAAARTLPLLQPRAFSRRTALTKPVDICFIISFPSIELLTFSVQSRDGRAWNRRDDSLGTFPFNRAASRFRRVRDAIEEKRSLARLRGRK